MNISSKKESFWSLEILYGGSSLYRGKSLTYWHVITFWQVKSRHLARLINAWFFDWHVRKSIDPSTLSVVDHTKGNFIYRLLAPSGGWPAGRGYANFSYIYTLLAKSAVGEADPAPCKARVARDQPLTHFFGHQSIGSRHEYSLYQRL